MKLVQSFLTQNPRYTNPKNLDPKGLMLHSVGCSQPSASVFVNLWNKASQSLAVHGFIDANDGTLYHTLPWNYRGVHGGGSSNNTHIGVEMCEPACIKYTSGSKFTCSDLEKARAAVKRTYDSAVELFAMLCKEYGLDPMTDICSHAEGYKKGIASNHGDPEHLWKGLGMDYTMDTFRNAVKAAMGGVSEQNHTTTPKGETTVNIELSVLKKGAKGEQVKALQRMLYAMGYDLGASKVDGEFGSKTDAAVRDYQKKNGLSVDGVVGQKTWDKLLKG